MKGSNKDPNAWYPGKHFRRLSSAGDKAGGAANAGEEGSELSKGVRDETAQHTTTTKASVTDENALATTAPGADPEGAPYSSSSLGGVSSDEAAQSSVTEGAARVTYATVRLSILDLKYIRSQIPSIQVVAEGRVRRPARPLQRQQGGTCFKPEEITFSIEDAFSDICIHLMDDTTGEIQGIIVIPLRRYLGVTGASPAKDEWMQFFPYFEVCPGARDDSSGAAVDTEGSPAPSSVASASPASSAARRRHSSVRWAPPPASSRVLLRAGDLALPGSAMTKPSACLGFLNARIQVELSMEAWKLLFLPPHPNSVDDSGVKGAVSLEPSGAPGRAKLLLPFDSEAWFLLLRRLERLAGPPSVLAPMLSFPEVFVVIILYGFLCFATELWQLPMIACFVLFANGFLSALDDRHAHVLVWNRSETAARRSVRVDDFAKFKSLQPYFAVFQSKLSSFVTVAEKFINLWNWSDARVSFVVYAFCFGSSVLLSAVLATLGPRYVLFIFGSIVLMVASGGASALLGEVSVPGGEEEEAGPPQREKPLEQQLSFTSASSETPSLELLCSQNLRKLHHFISRIPDSTILEHNFIAASSLVFEDGAEMQDAAEAMPAAAKS